MGALHKGHTSLIEMAKAENDIVVVSIFVNPTQFNNPSDLKNYPRTPDEDEILLIESQADVLFAPEISEMYSEKDKNPVTLDIGSLGTTMEGEHRPGHFAGVIQIVAKLFDAVKPDRAYFGEKDFQQLAVIRYMTGKLNYDIEIIGCPTVREVSGLAMSSRNLRLSDKGRAEAAKIYQALLSAKAQWKKYLPVLLKNHVKDMIEADGHLKVEYIEIADEISLQSVNTWDQFPHSRIFAAVYCEDIRLIDNVRLF
jgi:pantoate--beta-alanine ligase